MKITPKKIFIILLLFSFACTAFSCSAWKKAYKFKFNTKDIKIALVLPEPASDSSWSSLTYNGLKRFQTDYQVEIAVVENVKLNESRKIFSSLADREFNLILASGYQYGKILKKVARMYPDTFFCILDGGVSQEPNLCSFNFIDEQYGYLVGVIAGLNTSTNKAGIVIGRKSPSTERIIIGLRKGLKSVNPKADLVVSYINEKDDIAKGREAGISQINAGVDVITHLADNSGIGVIKAAEEADVSAIGAVTDQHDLAPTTIITSGILDVSQLVYLACESYIEQILQSKVYRFGLKSQVIDLAPTYGNVDPTTETRINRIKSKIAELESGEIEGQK